KQLAIGGVPELDGTVLAGARELAAVWAECDGVYRVRMGKFLDRTARWNVPDFGGVVGAAGCQHLPVVADRQGEDEVLMPGRAAERLDLFAGRSLPHLERLVE